MWGEFGRPLKRAIWNTPGLHTCCTDGMFEISVHFARCVCCLLPPFVNRQLPYPYTNSHRMLLPPLIRHKSLWCAKERGPGVQIGCR